MRHLGLGSLRAIRLPKMTNKYQVGYMAERRARKILEFQRYLVIRSAGSKGPFDLVGISLSVFKLIQVKVCPFGKVPVMKKLKRDLSEIMVPSNCQKELWIWEKKRGFHYFKI